MSDDDLCWRVEAACRAAWPTAAEREVDGWIVRAAGGTTRRLNSVNPRRDGPRDPAPLLGDAAQRLAAVGRPLTVRVPTIAPGLDAALDRLGFGPAEGETLTLMAPPDRHATADVVLASEATPAWLRDRQRFAQLDAASAAQLATTVALLPPTTRFATVHRKGQAAAVGIGTMVDGLLVLEAIVADPAQRRRGHAQQLVAAVIDFAATVGAEAAVLQVQADNAPALALYRSLGFDRVLYRYHYRVRRA